MYRSILAALAICLLVACGGAPALSAPDVVKRFQDAGLDATNVRDDPIPATAPIPRSYSSHINFTIPSAGLGSDGKTRGGQVFVCDTKQNCDAILAYFAAVKALGGAYYYQSPSGTVVVQMNGKIPADVAAKYATAVAQLP